jgi:hypothetical protein
VRDAYRAVETQAARGKLVVEIANVGRTVR